MKVCTVYVWPRNDHHDATQAKVLRAAHMLAMHLAAGEPVREATLELRDCAVALLRISVMNPKCKRVRSTVATCWVLPVRVTTYLLPLRLSGRRLETDQYIAALLSRPCSTPLVQRYGTATPNLTSRTDKCHARGCGAIRSLYRCPTTTNPLAFSEV